MRNIFDQYNQPENRLTHSLVMGLAQDESLLRKFIFDFTNKKIPRKQKIKIIEQSIPGKLEISEEEAEKRGLPDAWIYTNSADGWALLIESKISARLEENQLTRHLRTAKRLGFEKADIIVLATQSGVKWLSPKYKRVFWTDIYEWLCKQGRFSNWAKLIYSYMEVAETKFSQTEYLKEDTLTKFTGIPFNYENPYTYLEAKRILGLILNELRKSKKLKNLGVDTNRPGRGAIKGKKETAVWDCLRFKEAGKTDNFTKHPHLTVVIHPERLQVLATLPNAAEGAIRKRIFGQGYEYFHRLVFQVAQSMKKVIKLDPAAKPYIQVLQRHYRSLNSPGIEDAVLKYDIRTILNKGGNKEKFQPQWIHATYDVMIKKKSNLQFEFGVDFPFSTSRTANNSKTINAIEESFFAMKSFILIAFHKERR